MPPPGVGRATTVDVVQPDAAGTELGPIATAVRPTKGERGQPKVGSGRIPTRCHSTSGGRLG